MTSFLLILGTAGGLAGIYFLLASGLSLIFGLMDVINMAHGLFYAVGGFAAYAAVTQMTFISQPDVRLLVGLLVAALVGVVLAALLEKVLIRRSYGDHVQQILLTIGVSFVGIAILAGVYGHDPRFLQQAGWARGTTLIAGARIPNISIVATVVGAVVLAGLLLFLGRTRHGLIIRAGSENSPMVRALGIDVRPSFTLIFAIGGGLAAIAGVLGSVYAAAVSPEAGANQLIFAFTVVLIGGLGSLWGTAIAAVLVAFTQQFLNFYGATGAGDIAVVALLAVVLLWRPQGLLGEVGR
jgi:branched-chain amino acid transport system permease protein